MKYRWLSFLMIVLSAIVLVGCAAPAAVEEPVQIRIGTQPWIGYGPWWIAQEKGLFEKYGLSVELVNFNQDQDVNAALASGQMEAANLATHTALKLYSAGLDIRLVLIEDASYEADAILAGTGIQSISDLKGKAIAYEEGTTSDLLLNYALAQNGMSIADVTKVPMPASDAGLALLGKQVDAAVTYEPYITEAVKQGQEIGVLYTAAERPGLISDVLVVSAKFAQDNPQAVKVLLKVWDEALAFYNSNPEDAKAIIAKNVGSEPQDLVTAFDGVRFYGLAENRDLFKGGFDQTIQDVAAAAQAMSLFETLPDITKLIDPTFLGE